MTPEIGDFAIILALFFALLQASGFILGYRSSVIITAAIAQFGFLAFAMLCLIICFIENDMSVLYVQEHSHQLLPFIYRVGAAWGGHEGSLLLWCLILSGWTVAFIIFSSNRLPKPISTKIITLLGWVSTGFITFLFFTSVPFKRIFPTSPINGEDLTPILQDPGLIFHPPMLYLGYVGFAIPFAFAICALMEGEFNKKMATTLRPWVIMPWSFLSCGIVLGSWWAYRVLGWGGWWFWDPVENASLLPWLSATALFHALIVSEKRNTFKGWTILLAIVTFALSLLGTFLVRSGVLVSVHTFASDPARGLFLLVYLAIIIGGALVYYGLRIRYFYQAPNFTLLSRETFLLTNSVILLTAVATISLGTLYPILLDALNLEKISVGEPYFNTVFIPIVLPLLLLMGFAPHVNWKQQTSIELWKKLNGNIFISIAVSFVLPWIMGFPFQLLTTIGIFLCSWIISATLQYLYQVRIARKQFDLQHAAMMVAHIGIAILALGITLNKAYSEEKQVKFGLNEEVSLAGYHFKFDHLDEVNGPNYTSAIATFLVQKNHHSPQTVTVESRTYSSHDQTLSKPGILANPWRDLYIALGSPLPDGAWSVRINYKPFVRWIWFGGFMLLAGGLLSLWHSIRENAKV